MGKQKGTATTLSNTDVTNSALVHLATKKNFNKFLNCPILPATRFARYAISLQGLVINKVCWPYMRLAVMVRCALMN